MRITGNTVAITGGASGIGLAIGKALLARSNTVIALGRDAGKLERARRDVAGLETQSCDITDEESIRAAVARLGSDFPALNVLVNAAGTSRACRFADDPNAIRIARDEIETNLLGTTMMIRLALPLLMRQPEAAVVVVSSGLAYAPHVAEPTHSATKAALHALCRCLRFQLRDTPVKVFDVLPPLTDTALTRNVKGKKLSPDAVARAVVSGLERNRFEIRVAQVKALYIVSKLSPTLAEFIVRSSAQTVPPSSAGQGGG